MSHHCRTHSVSSSRNASVRRTLAFAAIALGIALPIAAVSAQSTSAHIFGQGPAGAKVDAHSSTGAHRSTTIRDDGRYDLRSLPMGTYTVTLTEGSSVADTRSNIRLTVGRGAEVDFACPHDQCTAGATKSP